MTEKCCKDCGRVLRPQDLEGAFKTKCRCTICRRLNYQKYNLNARGPAKGYVNMMNIPRDPVKAALHLAEMAADGPMHVYRFPSGAIQMRRTDKPIVDGELVGVYDEGCDWRLIRDDLTYLEQAA